MSPGVNIRESVDPTNMEMTLNEPLSREAGEAPSEPLRVQSRRCGGTGRTVTPDQELAAAGIVLSTVLGVCALAVSIYTANRANNNQSSANFLTLEEALRDNFDRYKQASTTEKRHEELANLLNLLEAASATLLDHAIHGRSKELLRKLVCDLLCAILKNDELRAFVASRRKTSETFRNIGDFIEEMCRQGRARELWKFIRPDGLFHPTI